MLSRELMLIVTLGTIYLDYYAYSNQIVGGWNTSYHGELEIEMVDLARQQLRSNTTLANKTLRVLDCQIQIVAGTNLRLIFMVGEEQECTLTAFKPLLYTKKSTEVTSFKCNNITSIAHVTSNKNSIDI
ncbi:unnamed protein product [Rotaria magnacalcarata]|uniref:Uncharacterized protein n=1 Tax=Rotaria magnacalcarata TaxID=392030 RepID=A0A816NP72_9BILA|nr:unnamed protein product [Rotaria magnacalcarata]CAF2077071.1 unnamed protein product [Rotaria magnacalcarata]CAF3754906.1 unnamed protein product [Rotaria magnacalcarata]CAF3774607.1 unnamed protein product [Rotaria magnacalcarata]